MQKVLLDLGSARISTALTVPAQEHFLRQAHRPAATPDEKPGLVWPSRYRRLRWCIRPAAEATGAFSSSSSSPNGSCASAGRYPSPAIDSSEWERAAAGNPRGGGEKRRHTRTRADPPHEPEGHTHTRRAKK